jgi:hypothetical protein
MYILFITNHYWVHSTCNQLLLCTFSHVNFQISVFLDVLLIFHNNVLLFSTSSLFSSKSFTSWINMCYCYLFSLLTQTFWFTWCWNYLLNKVPMYFCTCAMILYIYNNYWTLDRFYNFTIGLLVVFVMSYWHLHPI